MDLRKALSVLSKSSPYAVATQSKFVASELDELKKCLYVETEIEKEFRQKLINIRPNEIVFLCGSSGDGKSEILTRYKKQYEQEVDFHLDATHSFGPKLNAIDTLNSVFSQQSQTSRALVIGINVGMLGNYEREGSSDHDDIKHALNNFFRYGCGCGLYTFLDFESFPKFKIVDGRVSSPFFSKLLDNVVRDDSGNKFREYFNKADAEKKDVILVANYKMLRNKHIQKVIIEILLNARIRKDQFVTARMLLDFIYNILTQPNYLFDNLFNGGDNELLDVLTEFDPGVIRNYKLDLFILHRTLELQSDKFQYFRNEVASKFGLEAKLTPQSTVRLMYLLRECSLENNYHCDYKDSFNDGGLRKYKEVWSAHKTYNGDPGQKKWLRDFYSDVVMKAISKYANRNAPYLSKDQFYLSSHGRCDLAAEVELSIVYQSIEENKSEDLESFSMYLEVDGQPLQTIPIGVNLLVLIMNIVDGYRPNKYDKNSVVLLENLIAKIKETASRSDVLYLYQDGKPIKIKAYSDSEIRVSGL